MEMPRNGTVPPRELHLHCTLHWQEIRSLWKIPHARAAKLRPEAAPPPSLVNLSARSEAGDASGTSRYSQLQT